MYKKNIYIYHIFIKTEQQYLFSVSTTNYLKYL